MHQTCIIFNPVAKGEKARRFRAHMDEYGARSMLKLTGAPGDARRLAAEAIKEGFETIVAAGGDGTVNEVLNGFADAPEGFQRARLGVLPLGTVNVFARELGMPAKVSQAWRSILKGQETQIDLPHVEYSSNGATHRRYFAQLAGAGLDARAVELVRWELKKKIGPLAYVLAGMQALLAAPAAITASTADRTWAGGLVLIGNGRLYGGSFRVFPKADLRDGLLEVCVFPRVNWLTAAHCGTYLLLRNCLPDSVSETFRAESITLTSPARVPFEIDGELIGQLPATFSVQRSALRVLVPGPG